MITITLISEASDAYHSAVFARSIRDLPVGNGIFDVRASQSRHDQFMMRIAIAELAAERVWIEVRESDVNVIAAATLHEMVGNL